jgi:DNA polymerase delta subunit 1
VRRVASAGARGCTLNRASACVGATRRGAVCGGEVAAAAAYKREPAASARASLSGVMRFLATAFTEVPASLVPRDAFYHAEARCGRRLCATTPWLAACGRTADGAPVTMLVGGVEPAVYLDVAGDNDALGEGERAAFAGWLGRTARCSVQSVELVADKVSLRGAEPMTLARVVVADPRHTARVSELWHKDMAAFRGRKLGTRVLEGDVPLATRFAVDAGAVPYCWLECDHAYDVGDGRLAAHWRDVRAHACDSAAGLAVAPLRLVAFDIECVGEPGRLPNAELGDTAIMIGAVTYRDATGTAGDDNVIERVVFVSGHAAVAPSDRLRIVTCDGEAAMLLAFRDYLVEQAADFITGYNTDRFDWPFLLGRACAHGIDEQFRSFGRLRDQPATVQKSKFESSARGREDDTNLSIVGTTNLDMLRWVRPAHKLRSYKLDAVAKKFLGDAEGKTGVHYTEIPRLFAGSPEDRLRLAEYCAYDAELAARIAFSQRVVDNLISMARVTGVDIHTQITGGQGRKVVMQLLRFCTPRDVLVPTRYQPREIEAPPPAAPEPTELARMFGIKTVAPPAKRRAMREPAAFSGAIVVEPKRGYYPTPITTEDFSSLYPSIMIEHNLCYSTLVRPGECCCHGHVADSSVEALRCCVKETPIGARFWRQHVRPGILPQMLRNLLTARAAAKREMNRCKAVAEDASQPADVRAAAKRAAGVWDCQQNALKIACNSIYGYTGAEKGKLPELRISASVTAYGRDMITYIIGLVERFYRGVVNGISPELDGVPLAANVVYGDTDSIMIDFGIDGVARCMQLGRHAATLINAAFRVRYLTPDAAEALRAEIAPTYATLEDALLGNPALYIGLLTTRLTSAIGIVFEKCLFPYLLINKKRYAGDFYMSNALEADKLHQSGIESVRRDNAVYTADTVKEVIKQLMATRDPCVALAVARQRVRALARNQVPLDALVISKGFSKPADAYANAATQPHLVVNARREQREPGSGYSLGDRVPYLFVVRPGQVPGRAARSIDYVEDVDYVRAHNLRPWLDYYISNQLRKPLTRIFDTVWGEGAADSLLFTSDVTAPAPTTSPLLRMFGGSATPAAAPVVVVEPRDAIERRVRVWTSRPRTDTTFMAAFSARAAAADAPPE